jgi:hypothetical protein
MADERDEKATQVGHQVVEQPESGEGTEVFYSRDEAQKSPSTPTPPTPPEPSSDWTGGGTSPAEADRISADQADSFAQKPHVYVAGAFVGAFVFAQVLKRITTGGN